MRLAGLQKLTLLDYPGEVACTVFTSGCNLRCPFCQNPELVLPELYADNTGFSADAGGSDGSLFSEVTDGSDSSFLPEEEFFDFLSRRRGRLTGVAVTGGEPTLHKDLPQFLGRIREMGFLVKLDTNGLYPDVLRKILAASLADYIAMDVKNSPGKYALTCGLVPSGEDTPGDLLLRRKASVNDVPSAAMSDDAQQGRKENLWERAKESIALLKETSVRCEFRTTVVLGLHTDEDIAAIARELEGSRPWYLQQFAEGIEGGSLVGAFTRPDLTLTAPTREDLERMKTLAQDLVPNVSIRGV